MEKQTRVHKYKNLRDEMKEEVAIDRHIVEETNESDDDFLAFLPKEEKQNFEDTLMEPLSYETLEKDDEEVKQALNEAKINVGKEQYNTRLDILNKIKKDDEDYTPAHEYQNEDFSQGHVVHEEPQKKMSLLEKLAAMSPEEDAEELKKFEEDMTVADLMKTKKAKKIVAEKPVQQSEPVYQEKVQPVKKEKISYDEDNDEDGSSKLVTILNYVVLVFIVILIVLAFFVVKQLLF